MNYNNSFPLSWQHLQYAFGCSHFIEEIRFFCAIQSNLDEWVFRIVALKEGNEMKSRGIQLVNKVQSDHNAKVIFESF